MGSTKMRRKAIKKHENKVRNRQRKETKEFQNDEEKSKDNRYAVHLGKNQSITIIM